MTDGRRNSCRFCMGICEEKGAVRHISHPAQWKIFFRSSGAEAQGCGSDIIEKGRGDIQLPISDSQIQPRLI